MDNGRLLMSRIRILAEVRRSLGDAQRNNDDVSAEWRLSIMIPLFAEGPIVVSRQLAPLPMALTVGVFRLPHTPLSTAT